MVVIALHTRREGSGTSKCSRISILQDFRSMPKTHIPPYPYNSVLTGFYGYPLSKGVVGRAGVGVLM